VPLVALGLALGRLPWRMAALCSGLIIVGLAAALAAPLPVAAYSTPIAFFAAGLALIAAGTRFALGLAIATALLIGAQAGLIGASDSPGPMFALGTVAGGAEMVFFPALLTARAWRPWMTIPFRIAASWLLAVGFMFFGLALRPLPTGSTVATDTPAQLAACPGPHRHGVNGEFICLPPDPNEKTPNLKKYDSKPPVLDVTPPPGGVQ